MEIKFEIGNDARELDSLSPRQFMIAWTTAIRQLVERRARERIGGDFGDVIARGAIQTDTSDPLRHSIYTGGENGYIAEHIHTGGVIRPKRAKYLAIPIDRSVKGLFAREVPGLVFLRKKNEGPNGTLLSGASDENENQAVVCSETLGDAEGASVVADGSGSRDGKQTFF